MGFVLTPGQVDLEILEKIFREKPILEILPEAIKQLPEEKILASEEQYKIAEAYLLAQAIGFSPVIEENNVRLALVVQILNLLKSGFADGAILNRLLAFHNREVFPIVPGQASAISQAAYLSLPLIGIGKVKFQGYELNAADVNDIFSWQPLRITTAQVNAIANTSTFSVTSAIVNLINLKTHLPWFSYLKYVLADLLTDNKQDKNDLPLATDILKKEINQILHSNNSIEITLNLNTATANLISSLQIELLMLSVTISEVLNGLIAASEPPITSTYLQALDLIEIVIYPTSYLKANSTEISLFNENYILNKQLTDIIDQSEQLLSLAFWAVTQVYKVFNPENANLTLATYYHSAYFVPKETVATQLVQITAFIKSVFPEV